MALRPTAPSRLDDLREPALSPRTLLPLYVFSPPVEAAHDLHRQVQRAVVQEPHQPPYRPRPGAKVSLSGHDRTTEAIRMLFKQPLSPRKSGSLVLTAPGHRSASPHGP